MRQLQEALERSRSAVVFTGAGVSTLCGIPDFRGTNGLYSQPGADKMFDIGCFRRDPNTYYRGARRWIYDIADVRPGPVHLAVAALERAGIVAGVVTQNIDMLHQKAGSARVIEVHGSPRIHRCMGCGRTKTYDEIRHMLAAESPLSPWCDHCGEVYKPDITFFGENLPADAFDAAERLADAADLMLVLGSSLQVHPACSIPERAARAGCPLFIVNAQPTPVDCLAVRRYDDLAVFAAAICEWLEAFQPATPPARE